MMMRIKFIQPDHDDMSSPDMEELHDTVQIIRDSAYARQLASIVTPLTVREQLKKTKQILQDSILARQLSMNLWLKWDNDQKI